MLAPQLSQCYDHNTKTLAITNMPFLLSLLNLEKTVNGPIEDLQISNVEILRLDGVEAFSNLHSLALCYCKLDDLNRLEPCKNLCNSLRLLNISGNKDVKSL